MTNLQDETKKASDLESLKTNATVKAIEGALQNNYGHIGVYGITGTGKTIFANQLAQYLKKEKDYKVVVYDWFHKNYNNSVNQRYEIKKLFKKPSMKRDVPFHINPFIPPRGVDERVWSRVVSELFCMTNGLNRETYQRLSNIIYNLIKNANIRGRLDLLDMKRLINDIEGDYVERVERSERMMSFKEKDMYLSLIGQLKNKTDDSLFYEMTSKGKSIQAKKLVEDAFDSLFELSFLESNDKVFITGIIMANIFYYIKENDIKLEKPIYQIIEEAHIIFSDENSEYKTNYYENIFEKMIREAKNFNLYFVIISQSKDRMNKAITNNLPVEFVNGFKDGKFILKTTHLGENTEIEKEFIDISTDKDGCLQIL